MKIKEKHAKIGKGELESIVVCLNRGYLFSSFDKKALMVAKVSGVEIITAGVIFRIGGKRSRNKERGSEND